ncbi:glycosyltransferase family A protein [Novosphingobium sp. B 225]|uniref:glycosyltransferase family A protein n=1 Tax=Novosphingobium sp. B 225 TaxID=1961849 RepID=UPI000B4A6674|nr:glycosyltransferase family A protein [Novosphingobium sp. B 225]
MEPLDFTVVIPLHNKREHVAATLASVLAQTLPPREVLVIDNNSTDGGPDLVRQLDSPLIRLLSEPEPGPGPARNRGIAEARHPWIAFLDADDLWTEGHLAALTRTVAEFPQAPLVATGFQTFTGTPPRLSPVGPAPGRLIDYYHAAEADLIWTSAVAARREGLIASGGFAAFPVGEDTDLWIRLALTGPFAVNPAVTALYRRDNGGIMDREQAALQRRSPPPSPVFATIDTLLADPRHAARHAALAAYGDGLRRRFARQLIYNAHPRAARALLSGSSARGGNWWLYRFASMVPAPVLRLLSRLWSARRAGRTGRTTR